MSKVKLHNTGKRTITGKDSDGNAFSFAPGKMLQLDAKTAARLLRLYPDEIQDIDAATAHFTNEPAVEDTKPDPDDESEEDTGWEEKTAKEITAFLNALEINVHSKHAKLALVAIANAAELTENALETLEVKDLQLFLTANKIKFEGDANKPRLIEQAEEFLLEKSGE